MIVVFIVGVAIIFLILLNEHLEEKREKEREEESKASEFIRDIDGAFSAVERYCQNFNSSLDHLKKIKEAFEGFISTNSSKDLRPFEGYEIPTNQFFFNEHFYILIDEMLVPKLIIVPYIIGVGDNITVKGDVDTIKKHLPYTKTIEEFTEFYEKCKKGNKLATEERRRRNRVRKALEKC